MSDSDNTIDYEKCAREDDAVDRIMGILSREGIRGVEEFVNEDGVPIFQFQKAWDAEDFIRWIEIENVTPHAEVFVAVPFAYLEIAAAKLKVNTDPDKAHDELVLHMKRLKAQRRKRSRSK